MIARSTVAVIAAVGMLAGCSTDEPTADEVAHEYATERSGGVTTGCSQAAPGPEAETEPGCIYTVPFAGCLHGITGERVGPLPVEEEFPDEPGLVERYYTAFDDCGD